MIAAGKEAHPLSWPAGWARTRVQDRKAMGSWKRTANQYREALLLELSRIECPSAVISSNVPLTERGGLEARGVEPLDVGVAVYFSRKRKEDFAWQDALDLHD